MCLALSCKSLYDFMLKTSHKGVLTEFSGKVSKFPQIIHGRYPTQTLVSCPCLGGAYNLHI